MICLKARWSSDKSELFRTNRRLGRRFDDAGREHRRGGECQLSIGVGPMCSRTSMNYVHTCVERVLAFFCLIRRVTLRVTKSMSRVASTRYQLHAIRIKNRFDHVPTAFSALRLLRRRSSREFD
jgi:hypothetical protein